MAELQGITAEVYRAIITIVDERVKEIRVTREDFDSLKAVVRELAEAQKRTEQRLDSLALRVEELAEAQKKTEEILQGVIKEQKSMRKEIGGLSATIGYTLENRAISRLPEILESDHGIHIELMDRRFIEYPDGKEEEVNIYGEGKINGERVYVIGKSKSQLGRKDVDKFKRRVERLGKNLGARIIPVLITHMVRPRIERYALQTIDSLVIYKSFQLEKTSNN